MESLAMYAAKNKVGNMVGSFKQQGQYKWDEYNFPPVINLFHLDISELPHGRKVGMRFIMIGLYALLIMSLTNFAFSIILTIFSPKSEWKWILLSFVNIAIFIVLFLMIAQRSFKAIAMKDGKCLYLLFGGGVIFLCIFFAVFPLAFFHGFIAMIFRNPRIFFYIFAPIESVCWLITGGLLGFGIFRGKQVWL
jgi:hypothetical protein